MAFVFLRGVAALLDVVPRHRELREPIPTARARRHTRWSYCCCLHRRPSSGCRRDGCYALWSQRGIYRLRLHPRRRTCRALCRLGQT